MSSDKSYVSASSPQPSQPEGMKTDRYIYGVEPLNGDDAWRMFCACGAGDEEQVRELLEKDPRLVNAQFWYQFPIHMAVREGRHRIVALLLQSGADPGQSRYTYNSWPQLLSLARDRGFDRIADLLERAMRKRFGYSPQFQELQQAILTGDLRKIDSVIRRRPDIVLTGDALGNNALHWCVLARQLRPLRKLVEAGAPLDALRADGKTPALLAVHGADYWYRETRRPDHPSLRNASVLVGGLLTLGARYVISIAAAVGDLQQVNRLLESDPGLATCLDSARYSPLSYAAREGHLHIVRRLLECGAQPNQPEEAAPQGLALYEACRRNHLEIARLLLAHGADPNAGVDSCECCLTIGAIYHGRRARPLQELLRRHGALFPPYRMSAPQLERAIRENQPVVRHEEFLSSVLAKARPRVLLAFMDSDPSLIDRLSSDGVGALGSPAVLRELLARGLDPNRTDWNGKTLLHACAERGDRRMAAMLLAHGADLNAREREFMGTPLAMAVRSHPRTGDDVAKKRGRRMIAFLLRRGAAANLPDDPPWSTPLAWARKLELPEIEELLLSRGAR